MAYIRGNLALKERTSQTMHVQRKKKVVHSKKQGITSKEKSLYLLTIVLCGFVSGFIIWRYAQIYYNNLQIQRTKAEIQTLQSEISVLKIKKEKKQDPIRIQQEATKLGLITIQEGQEIGIVNPAQAYVLKDEGQW